MSQYNFDELYGAGVTSPAPNPAQPSPAGPNFDELSKVQDSSVLQSSLFIASNDDPEANRKRVQLTSAWRELTGEDVPWRNIEANSFARKLRRRVNEETLKQSPTLAKLYEDPKFAGLSFDETEALWGIEKVANAAKGVLKSTASGVPSLTSGLYNAAAVPFDIASQYVGKPLAGKLLPEDIFGKVGAGLRKAGSNLAGAATAVADVSPDAGLVERSIASGFQSLGQNVPPLLGALFTRNPNVALAPMTVSSGGASYSKALAAGLDPTSAAKFGATDAIVEGLTERIAVTKLLTDVSAGTPFLKTFVNNMINEQLGEQAATVLQDFNEWAVLNPQKPFSEYLAERPSAALQTAIATAIGTGGQVTILKGVEKAMQLAYPREYQAQRAQENLQYFTGMVNAAGAVQLRAADPESFQRYMQEIDSEVAYLDPRELQDSGIDVNVLAQALPSVAEQITQAVENNHDIVIPRDELFTRLPGSGLEQQLLPILRAGAEEVSAKGAEQQLAEAATFFQAETEKLIQQAQVDDAAMQSQQAVEQDLIRQLKETNRFTDDVNNAYAKLMSTFFGTLAARLNKGGRQTTAEEQYQKFVLRVNAQGVAGEQQLDQNTPEFQKWFGRSVARQFYSSKQDFDTAPPLQLYVGRRGDFPSFEAGRETTNTTTFGSYTTRRSAIFLSESPEMAGDFAAGEGGNVVPAYIKVEAPLDLVNGLSEEDEAKLEAAGISTRVFRTLPNSEYWALFDEENGGEDFVKALQAAGYDGVVFSENRINEGDADRGGASGETTTTWAVFRPEQIKSIFNARPTDSPNIMEQSASIRRGTETLKRFGLDPTKKHTTRQVAAALEARQREKYGSVARDDRSPETARKLAKWMVEEVLFEVDNPGSSGVGWYSVKFQAALDTMAEAFPELATDQNARDVMTALIAVTSDGQKVNENFLMAMDAYAAFKDTGKFKPQRGHSRGSIQGNLDKIQKLHDELGAEGMKKFLLREVTIAEINATARIAGEKTTSDYTADTKMPVAATVFGPKLGAFYANLMGSHGYLTMDRWWSRTFNRYRGTLVMAPTRQGLDRFKQLIGKPQISDDEAIAETVPYRKSYEARSFKDGSEIEKAANTIYKAAFEGLEDTPFNASDRKFMVQTVKYAQQNLKRRGIEMPVADIQAVLWYYEKRLYGELGARQSADVSYEEAAKRAVASRSGAGSAGAVSATDTAGGFDPGGTVFSYGAEQPGSEAFSLNQSARLPAVGNPRRAATTADFTKDGIAGILARSDWAILTAENPAAQQDSTVSNDMRMDTLRARLKEMGLKFVDVKGKYGGNEENSIAVVGITKEQAVQLGKEFGQQSVLTNAGLVYADGSIEPSRGVNVLAKDAEDFYTILPDGTKFSVDIDFNNRWQPQELRIGEVQVVGVHFSTDKRTTLLSSMYGRGARGAEYDRVMSSPDKRLSKRVHFYVNTGRGVRAERNVGGQAHVALLTNIYDANADPLGIWKAGGESAVLDAGFSGFLDRKFGAVVTLENVAVEYVGDEAAANARVAGQVVPEPQYTETRKQVNKFLADPRLPAGQQTVDKWADTVKLVAPEYNDLIRWSELPTNEPLYKDQLVRNLYQGEQARGQITFGDDITKSPTTITMLKNADLSTFLHEAGHFYLEVLNSVANQQDAPQEIVDDLNKALGWMGVDGGLAAWNTMTLEQKRPHHEQFARGFEAYLFEGKAPSAELKGLFSRFRAWLINVYRQITGLNVQLTDEVRGVFDRMLATEEQIKEAETLRGMAPLFNSAEEMGATPEEWAAYQNQHSDATQVAAEQLQARSLRDMKWLNNARSRTLRKLQSEVAAKRNAVEDEVRAEILAQPVYAVQRFLRYGELPQADRTNRERKLLDSMAGVPTKLQLAALKEMYGEGPAAPWRYLATGKDGMAATDGVHPDIVAELFGFTSGDSMVRQILAAEKEQDVVEALTDQRMLERYGDMSSPAAQQRAVDEALHNEARGKFIATEMAALANALRVREDTGRTITDSRGRTRKLTSNVLVKAAKDFASNLVERKKIKDVRPSQFTTAEARAAKAAEKTSNFTEKVTEKRNQLVNHYAARFANEAVDYVEKQVAYLRKVADSETIDPEYRDQIHQLLEKVELRRITQREEQRRTSLLEWIENQEAQGLDPVIDRSLVEQAQVVNYRNLTVEQFRGLVDSVKNIEHLGRLKHKLLTAKDERELAAVVAELQTSINDNANRQAKVRMEAGRGVDRIGKMLRGFVAAHRKFASIVREMDGGKDGGSMWERFVRPMNEAGDNEVTMRAEATQKLAEIFKMLDGIKLTRKEEVLPGVSLTREAQIMLALNWGNEGNRQRVIDGGLDGRRRLTPAEAERIITRLSDKEWDFVESVWDFIGSYRPMIAAQEKRLTGVEPKWVDAAPFTLPNGRQIKGGYFPAKYDAELSTRSNELEAVTDLRQQMKGAAGRAATRNGYTKERSTEVKDRPLRKDFGVIMQHVGEVTHRLAWQDWLIDARRLLNSKAVDGAVREHYGPDILKQMKDQIRDIAQGDIGAQSDLDRILGHARSGVTIAGMGWNLATGLMQPLGVTQSIVRIGSGWFAKGLAHFAANPIESTKIAQEKSKFMASRSLQLNRDLTDILNRIDKKELSVIENSYFWFIYKFQTAVDVPTWWGAYERAVAEGNDEARSIALADQAVIDAQGGGHLKDQAAIQRGGSAQKLFTAFYSYFSTTYNLAVEQGRTAAVKGGMAVPKLVSDYALLFVIPAIGGALLKAVLKGEDLDDEEKLVKKLIAEQLNYLLGTMILTREIGGGISAAFEGFNYTGPAALRVFGEVAKFTKQAMQGEIDAPLLKAANNVAGIVLHYPAGQVQRTVEGMHALVEGDTQNPAAAVFGPPRK